MFSYNPMPSALHFSTLSSARSVELIRQAKAKGMPVSCDVAIHQLVFDDSALAGMDDARLGALAALNLARDKPDAAGAAVAGTAIEGQVNAVLQSGVQQQLTPARREAVAVDRNLVAF